MTPHHLRLHVDGFFIYTQGSYSSFFMSIFAHATGTLMQWDLPSLSYATMPLMSTIRQSNTVTQSVFINRKTGMVFPFTRTGVECIHFNKITQKVQDLRFRAQRHLSLQSFATPNNGTRNKNTVLISLTGVVVSTGARNVAASVYSVASTSRIANTYKIQHCADMIHADLSVVNRPHYGR